MTRAIIKVATNQTNIKYPSQQPVIIRCPVNVNITTESSPDGQFAIDIENNLTPIAQGFFSLDFTLQVVQSHNYTLVDYNSRPILVTGVVARIPGAAGAISLAVKQGPPDNLQAVAGLANCLVSGADYNIFTADAGALICDAGARLELAIFDLVGAPNPIITINYSYV